MHRVISKIPPKVPALPKLLRVAAYARVSSGKDAMLHSLSAQVSYYSALIQKNPKWEFVGTYADEAKTGTKDERDEFQRLLLDCRNGRIDMVITKSISRFARNTVTLLETTRELKALNVDVFFESENIHCLHGEGDLLLTLLAAYAQSESFSVSENCKWRIRSRFKAGEPANWRFLFGYRIDKNGIQIEPQQAEVVRMVYQRYLEGWGFTRIIKELERLQVPCYFDGRWEPQQIANMLRNEKYTGNALLQKQFVADHLTKKEVRNTGTLPMYYAQETHEGIIDMDTFRQVQSLLAARKEKHGSTRDYGKRYAFTGKLFCALCGEPYHRRMANAGTKYARPAWICSTFKKQGKQACLSKQVPEDTLIEVCTEALGLPCFDEAIFKCQIHSISMAPDNRLIFHFLDATQTERAWQDHSRSACWDLEARQRASIKELQRRSSL